MTSTEAQPRQTPRARDSWLLIGGGVLLTVAGVLPHGARIVVLPALLLVPGYALLLLLGRPPSWRGLSIAVPVSLVMAMCASLLLDVLGIRLDAVSLGSTLGAGTLLFVAGAYALEASSARRRAPTDEEAPQAVASPGEG